MVRFLSLAIARTISREVLLSLQGAPKQVCVVFADAITITAIAGSAFSTGQTVTLLLGRTIRNPGFPLWLRMVIVGISKQS
jgi:hypothetical protein